LWKQKKKILEGTEKQRRGGGRNICKGGWDLKGRNNPKPLLKKNRKEGGRSLTVEEETLKNRTTQNITAVKLGSREGGESCKIWKGNNKKENAQYGE